MYLLRVYSATLRLVRSMSSLKSEALVPVGVRGMTVLDRDKFSLDVTIPVLKVGEDLLAKTVQVCKPYFLKFENFKPVQTCETNGTDSCTKKYIHLNPEKVTTWSDIREEDRNLLESRGIDENCFMNKLVKLTYSNWKFEQIFKSVLPENEEVVSSFSQIGHIIHLNLRDHLLDYRSLIGQVLVDKIKTCRTVVNKCNIIDNTYRNFKMEVIAGDDDFLVTVSENRCNFQFDFSKVYWNPRLGKEHERILSFLKPDDVLFDVFCGVGPFAVPAAKRKCRVFANDLNPDSYHWLNENAKNNKVNMKLFQSYNLDGKDFIQTVFKKYMMDYCKGEEKLAEGAKIHVTMNLPALAVEFLQYFNGLIKDSDVIEKLDCNIIVYVYCFAVGDCPASVEKVAKEMVYKNIGCNISSDIVDVFDVRNVSPKKEMMRVTFKLSKNVLSGDCESISDSEPPQKKVCIKDDN